MQLVMEGGMFWLKSTVQATAQGLNKIFGGVNMCAEHQLYIIVAERAKRV